MFDPVFIPALLSGTFLFCVLILAGAGFIHGMFGVGYAMIATPLMALLVDYRLAVILAAVPLFIMALTVLARYRHALRENQLVRMIVPGVIVGSALGAWLHTSLPAFVALALLGVLLAVNAYLPSYFRRRNDAQAVVGPRAAPGFSLLAGVTEAALNVGAPFILMYSGLARLTRVQQLLALNLCYGAGKLIQIGVLMQAGTTPMPWPHLFVAIAASLGGQMLGERYAGQFSETTFRFLFTRFLYTMALVMLCRAIYQIAMNQ